MPLPGKKRLLYVPVIVLIEMWFAIWIDCLIVDAREACWLACGMMILLLPVVLIRKENGGKIIKVLKKAALLLSFVLHLYIIGMIVFLMLFAGRNLAAGDESDVVILLGSDLKNDWPGGLLESRIDKATDVLTNDLEVTVLACGGLTGTNTRTEAYIEKTVLELKGIAPERILCEDQSSRTLDNLQNAADMFADSEKWNCHQRTAVITNRFHFYRTNCLAKSVGYDALCLIPAECSFASELPWIIREVMTVTKFWVCGPN